ncbi:Major allergen d 1 [Quillaja saponaria]|uniref:Major allergen d 1 n=1 Tax=Quillaja saponaria TaxID=32244 RepID=A0AAD7LBP7_QUISA|nr:Major allergen d 1 [Quillaja saponaria]
MGVSTFEHENSSVIPPARLFKALILDGDNLVPKIAPQAIQSIVIIKGDGSVGSIKKITFFDDGKVGSYKENVEAIDKENLIYSYSFTEGDLLPEKLEKVSYETKFLAGPDGGSIVKNISKYITKGDAEITQEEANAGNEKGVALLKVVEAYLVANPDAYN